MSSEFEQMAVFEYELARAKPFIEISDDVREQGDELEDARRDIARHDTELHGESGVFVMIALIRQEVGGMRKAFYALTTAISAGTIALAAAVITHAL